MADRLFEEPSLARLYNPFDPDRSDLDAYRSIVGELGARRVLDIGCGTGTFACMLGRDGVEVVGLDPALASLEIARKKPGAESVRWVHGDVGALPPLTVDLVTMTGNVAQVFVTATEWKSVLDAVHGLLAAEGHLVFESRAPEDQAWLRWTAEMTRERLTVPGVGTVDRWVEVTDVQPGTVSLRWTFVFELDGATLTSDSTLRFRTREEIEGTLRQSGFAVRQVRGAADRPGRELVFIAQRAG